MRNKLLQKKDSLILIILILFSVSLNISLIFNDSVWFDESYSMITLRNNFRGIIEITASDVHPPLYYLITKCILLILGYSVPAAKISSLLGMLFTMLLGIHTIRRHLCSNKRQSLFASVLFILMLSFIPCSMRENIEIRMYTWAMFFVTASAIYALEIYLNATLKKNWILFTVMSICAAYTHYFALVTVCIIYAFLFLVLLFTEKKYIKSFLLVCVVSVLSYLPWLPVFFQQLGRVSNGFWIPEFTLTKLLEYLQWLFNGPFTYVWLIIIVFCVLLVLCNFIDERSIPLADKQSYIFIFLCFLTFTGTIFSGWILSKLIRPIFVERYIFISMGLLYIFIACSCSCLLKGKTCKLFILSLLLCTSIFSYNTQRKEEYENGTEATKQVMSENIDEKDLIATNDSLLSSQEGSPLRYYLPNNKLNLIQDETQLAELDSFQKTWYFSTGNFNQALFESAGYQVTYICDGTIDTNQPYTLYLIEKKQ